MKCYNCGKKIPKGVCYVYLGKHFCCSKCQKKVKNEDKYNNFKTAPYVLEWIKKSKQQQTI